MIKDADGQEVSYIPLQLESGAESAVIPLFVTPSGSNQRLKATASPDATVKGRYAGAGAYVNLSAAPLLMPDGLETAVEIKVEAGDITGMRRVLLSLNLPESGAAGWAI